MRKILTILAAALTVAQPGAAWARNILITNDDGLTSNVVALYHALKARGHDVVVSVPCFNQSGMGAALNIGHPLGPLSRPCLNDAAQAGDPGAGPMTREGLGQDFHYVASTPVVALLHGLDVVAAQRWNAEPDLVLSGPNEGQNVGAIILSSGTVGAAQTAALRGLPAIALSAGGNTEDAGLQNPASAIVGTLSADLVDALDRRAKGGPLLPQGTALNVNFPDDLTNATIWRISRLGTYNAYRLQFTTSLAAAASPTLAAMAERHGQTVPDLPGLSFEMNADAPRADQLSDESVVYRTAIAVSPMQAGYAHRPEAAEWLAAHLQGFATTDETAP